MKKKDANSYDIDMNEKIQLFIILIYKFYIYSIYDLMTKRHGMNLYESTNFIPFSSFFVHSLHVVTYLLFTMHAIYITQIVFIY